MPLSCVSAPALTEEERQEALEAKFFAAGSTRRGRSSSADMSPSYADESASVSFDTPDGTHALAKRWTHPDGPRPFHPRCSPRAVVAGVPGAKKHRCLLVNVGDALVVHNFNPRVATTERDDDDAYHAHTSPTPIRVLTFPGTTVTAVAHRDLADDDVGAPDVLVGLGNGEVLLLSLRALIADRDGKALPPGTRRFNTDGGGGVGGSGRVVQDVLSHQDEKSAASKKSHRCTSVAWFAPTRREREISLSKKDEKARDLFLSTHADGNAYVYSAALGDDSDPRFAELRGSVSVNAVSLTMGKGFLFDSSDTTGETEKPRETKSPNPFARMRVGPAALTAAAVAPGGEAVALAAADGQVRVLDVRRVASGDVALVDGFKSHFGGVDAVAWAEGPPDFCEDDDVFSPRLGRFRADACAEPGPATPRFLLAGGEADVVEVWDRPRRALAARARGHASWIAHVAETPPRVRVGATKKKSDEEKSDALFAADDDETAVDKKTHENTYDDLLGEADEHTRRLRFASAGQDCRVCFWEMDVDPAPAWWIPVAFSTFSETDDARPGHALSPRDGGKETVKRSANVDVPGGWATEKERASDSESRSINRDEDEAPPFVPSRVALGAAPEASRENSAADASASFFAESAAEFSVSAPPGLGSGTSSSVPSSALTSSSLMFPTLREELRMVPEDTNVGSRRGSRRDPCHSRDDVFGDGRVVARAASSRSTPCIAPFSAQLVHAEPCTSLAFVDEGFLTACGGGVVKLWRRTG